MTAPAALPDTAYLQRAEARFWRDDRGGDLMSAATALGDTSWSTFRRAVMARPAGTTLTVDTIRVELETAGIPPAAYGALFRRGCHTGLLWTDGRTVASKAREARGRRVLVYVRVAQRQGKAA